MGNNQLAIYRLTALWAFLESGLGGILHALKIPVTGFIVGAMAVIILSLIARLAENTTEEIFKALVVVLLIKLTISPHASIGAFIAVGFQGLSAILIFNLVKNFRLAIVILSVLAMVESAVQKIAVLTLIFGNTLWDAANQLANYISKTFNLGAVESVSNIIWSYVLLYAAWGLIVGFFAYYLSQSIFQRNDVKKYQIVVSKNENIEPKSKKRRYKKLIVLLLLMIAILSYLYFWGEQNKIVYIILRAVAVLLFFYKIVGPILRFLLTKYLQKYASIYLTYVNDVLDAIPYANQLTRRAWEENRKKNSRFRIREFIVDALLYNLHYTPPK